MESVFLKMLFIVSVSAHFGKHVYVQHKYKWPNAQKHCRDHYTDLSPISSWRDEKRLKKATEGMVSSFWIGLYRNVTHWRWSGGGHARYTRWDNGHPEVKLEQNCTSVCWKVCGWEGWHTEPPWLELPFFCFNLIVMEYKATWEQAERDCRWRHTDLTSLTSETEHLLALRKIQQNNITERVWIGLRYLVDHWMWVDGSRLGYKAWPEGTNQDNQCPEWKRCGSLTKAGLWEKWDCRDKLNFICY